MGPARNVVLLGATGSIGESTLRVIRKHRDRLNLLGISAHQQGDKLCQIAHEFAVKNVHLGRNQDLGSTLPAETYFSTGPEALNELAALEDADLVVVAVVGAAGLAPTLAALAAGKDVVLANKESLVVGGQLVVETARRTGARILPADRSARLRGRHRDRGMLGPSTRRTGPALRANRERNPRAARSPGPVVPRQRPGRATSDCGRDACRPGFL